MSKKDQNFEVGVDIKRGEIRPRPEEEQSGVDGDVLFHLGMNL